MTTIYLIRSAEAEGDLYRIAHGHSESDLTDRGRRQITALKRRFSNVRIDEVYTSDLYRARTTSEAVCGPSNPSIHLWKELREIYLGAWEGENWGGIAYRESAQRRYFETSPDRWRAEGAETAGQASSRMVDAIRRIAKGNDDKSVAVVSHGFAIRLLLRELQDASPGIAGEPSAENNTAVSVIEAGDDALRLTVLDDVGHLSDSEYLIHEKPRAELDFSTDMYFHPLPWFEYGEAMAEAVECVWQEAGEDRPFDKNILLGDAAMLPTIVGFVEYEPAGFLQLGMEPGRITLLCTHPGCRQAGLGAQLIGQAVTAAKANGANRLYIALPEKNPYRQFFRDNGFVSARQIEDGREIFEKQIRFDPDSPNG
jgi:probable phosphoglycerate mutase